MQTPRPITSHSTCNPHEPQDFVELVCGDVTLTSNDPLDAFLLDGGFVRSWAQSWLQRLQKQVGVISDSVGSQ